MLRRKVTLFLIVLCMFLIAACNKESTEKKTKINVSDEEQNDDGAAIEVVAGNLDVPWSIQKLNETFYISERSGTIAVIQGGKVAREQVEMKKTLSSEPESGLLGFVLKPDFQQSQEAYAYYTYDEDGKAYNRVITLKRENSKWKENKTLLDEIPSGQFHHGGRMQLGPDGLLYVTTGDALNEDKAQDKNSLSGKILRMNLDGSIPKDNPSAHSYVYSYGHRNPQGLAWDQEGNLYSSEHGPSAHDEVNRIHAGDNYGWPVIKGDSSKGNMEEPIIHSGNETWAPSGIAYKDGSLYIAALRGEAIKRYDIKSNKMENMITGIGRIRDVFVEGDSLYFISNNTDGRGEPSEEDDQLYKIQL